MKFHYLNMGQTSFIDADDRRQPILGNYVYGVSIGEGEYKRVLGLLQPHPSFPGKWRAVASLDPTSYPSVDLGRGLWDMEPGRSDFGSKREAAVWLLGMSDGTQTAWLGRAVQER